MRAVYDAVVIQEWAHRLSEYNRKSAWLRLPMYGGIIGAIMAAVLLPMYTLPYIFGAFCINLCLIGYFLSKYSRGALKCPHCDRVPYSYFSTHSGSRETCKHCGYWLVDHHAKKPS